MALVNIGEGNRDDGFYRYKMPRMITKIEGRGNGIKTNLVNMVDVAKALARPPSYTTKYFGCVLGAQSKFDDKTGTSTVNGAHDNSKLTQLLEGFIKKYVQCYGCGNPETEVVITKNQMIILKCAACGYLSDVDMRDKLTTYILNNPPETKKSKGAKLRRAEKERLSAGEAADKESKVSKKSTKKKGEESAKKSKKKDEDEKQTSPDASQKDEEEAADDDDVEWQTDTSAEAAKRRIEEQLTQASSEMVMLHVDDEANGKKAAKEKGLSKSSSKGSERDEDFSEPPSPSPSANGSSNGKASSTPLKHQGAEEEDDEDDEDEEEEESEHEKLVSELKDYASTHTLAETAAYVKSKGDPTQELMLALFEALFGGMAKGLAKEVAKKKVLLGKILPDEAAQTRLLVAIEHHCGVAKPEAAKETSLVLKALYDSDIVDEEQINGWYDRKQALQDFGIDAKVAAGVRKEAAPFVQWLREAEAESDDE